MADPLPAKFRYDIRWPEIIKNFLPAIVDDPMGAEAEKAKQVSAELEWRDIALEDYLDRDPPGGAVAGTMFNGGGGGGPPSVPATHYAITGYGNQAETPGFDTYFTLDPVTGVATCVTACWARIHGYGLVVSDAVGIITAGLPWPLALLELTTVTGFSGIAAFDLRELVDTSGLFPNYVEVPPSWPFEATVVVQFEAGNTFYLAARFWDGTGGQFSVTARMDIIVFPDMKAI